jgi:glycosyltransferase involved in cell wall biosynthesis
LGQHLPQPPIVGGLRLYWRNAVIAPGARGLQDAIAALALLPKDVVLSAQGNRSPDGERAVRAIAESRGVSSRVHLLEPHLPGAAVKAAAEHMVGLCLEREGPKNHDLTVSNKMFDYHMAGLAVIASDRPSLKAVLEESRGGLVYRSGDVGDLAAKIRALYDDRHLLASLAASARAFALSKGNAESEMRKLVEGFRQKVLRPQSFPRTTP